MERAVDAILACRVQGTRLYGKPLQPLAIGGITVIGSLIQYLKAIRSIRKIILAISDGKENAGFISIAEKNSLSYVIGDEQDVLGRMIKAAEQENSEYVFRVTTEDPFVLYEFADALVEVCLEGDYDFADYEETPEGTGFELIKAEALRVSHKKGNERHRSELITSYIFDRQDDFRIIHKQLPAHLRRPEVRLTVDYAEDLVFCQKAYKALSKGDHLIKVEEIIRFWDENPDLRKPLEEIGIDWGTGRLWR